MHKKAVELMPQSIEAIQNLGACFFLARRFEEAAQAARAEVALKPQDAAGHFNLGTTLSCLSQTLQACESFERVIQINPEHFDARIALVRGYLQMSRVPEASKHSAQAIRLKPTNSTAHLLHGIALSRQELPEAAVPSFQRCVALDPKSWDGFFCLAEMLMSLKRLADALPAYQAAYRLRPAERPSFEGLVHALHNLQEWTQLAAVIYEALKLPQLVNVATSAKAAMLQENGQPELAMIFAKQALVLDPSSVKAMIVVSNSLWDQQHYQLAIDSLSQALKKYPDSPTLRFNLALRKLTMGDPAGWADYEFRRHIPGLLKPPPLRQNQARSWDGSDLTGKTLLLYHEGGSGDFLQFVRGLPELAKRAKRVVVLASPSLVPVIPKLSNVVVTSFVEHIPVVDFQVGDMSLAFLLGWSPTHPPTAKSYLEEPPPPLLNQWQRKLNHLKGFRIGIAWSGYAGHLQHQRRIIPLELLGEVASIDGDRLVSLQVGSAASDIQRVGFPIFDPSPGISTFADTVAIIRQLDLVVTVDTSVAHLAGAIGAPTWTMLPKVGDFRWMLEGNRSPWYPSMRLFRQEEPGRWKAVVDQVVQSIRELTSAPK